MRCRKATARRACSRSASPAKRRTSRSFRPSARRHAARPPTSVSLFDQGLIQMLQASVTGLEPKQPYVLALARRAPTAAARLEPLAPS